jgi:hypothetical protein
MKYKSVNTGEYVSAHQYIAELIVKRKADKLKEILPNKYWNLKDNKWAKEYRSQVQQSARLTKKYSPIAITRAMTNLSWCYSLFNKTLLEEIKKEQKVLDSQNKLPSKTVEISKETKPAKAFSRKNKLGKLK